jgi:ribonuclease Z
MVSLAPKIEYEPVSDIGFYWRVNFDKQKAMNAILPKLWLTSFLLLSSLVVSDQARAQANAEDAGDGEDATPIVVTLLGTSPPTLDPDQPGTSTLITIGKTQFLIDAGRGVVSQLAKLNPGKEARSFAGVDQVFITHLHFDHIVSFDDFWLARWLNARQRQPLRVWGPDGTQAFSDHIFAAYEADLSARFAMSESIGRDGNRSGTEILTTDVTEDSVIYAENGITVTAFAVDHDMPALGYRIDYANKAVVISGDTTYSRNLIKHARNVDLIIHEVFDFAPQYKNNPLRTVVLGAHTTPQQAADLFNQTKPKLAVFSHIGYFGGDGSDIDFVGRTREHYPGRIILGEALMTITIADDVTVKRPVGSD